MTTVWHTPPPAPARMPAAMGWSPADRPASPSASLATISTAPLDADSTILGEKPCQKAVTPPTMGDRGDAAAPVA